MTIINHGYRFVFVHIPKNAGTSVAQYLSRLSAWNDLELGATELGQAQAPAYRARFGLHKHSTYAEIESVVGPDLLRDYTTVAVIRDPYERTASTFSFLKGWTGWHALPRYAGYASDFKEQDLDAFVASPFFATPGPDRLFEPQVTWLTSGEGDAIAIDRLLRVEHIDDDVDTLAADLDWPPDRRAPLGHENRSRKSASVRLSDSARSAIARRYRADLERLGNAGHWVARS